MVNLDFLLMLTGEYVRCVYINCTYRISQDIRSQRSQILITVRLQNEEFQSPILSLLYFNVYLKLYNVRFQLFLFRFIVAHIMQKCWSDSFPLALA